MLNEFRADHQQDTEPGTNMEGKPKILIRQAPDSETQSHKLKKVNPGRPPFDKVSEGSALDLENLQSEDLKNTNRAMDNMNYDFNKILF